MCLGKITKNGTFLLSKNPMENSNEQKIVGVVIDNKLNLKSHISGLCKKKTLSKLPNYLNYSESKKNFQLDVKILI